MDKLFKGIPKKMVCSSKWSSVLLQVCLLNNFIIIVVVLCDQYKLMCLLIIYVCYITFPNLKCFIGRIGFVLVVLTDVFNYQSQRRYFCQINNSEQSSFFSRYHCIIIYYSKKIFIYCAITKCSYQSNASLTWLPMREICLQILNLMFLTI